MLVMNLPILVCENKVTNVDCWFTNNGKPNCFSNIGIYNTFPTLVCHIRIPMIPQSLTSEIPNFHQHWNLKFFPVMVPSIGIELNGLFFPSSRPFPLDFDFFF